MVCLKSLGLSVLILPGMEIGRQRSDSQVVLAFLNQEKKKADAGRSKRPHFPRAWVSVGFGVRDFRFSIS